MPKLEVTIRFKAFPDLEEGDFTAVKKSQREDIKKQYPGAKILSQKIITDGIPDRISLGELRANGQVALRTEVEVSQEIADQIKKRSR